MLNDRWSQALGLGAVVLDLFRHPRRRLCQTVRALQVAPGQPHDPRVALRRRQDPEWRSAKEARAGLTLISDSRSINESDCGSRLDGDISKQLERAL